MKLFDLSWVQVLRDLARWEAVTLPARRVLLDVLKPSGYVPSEALGSHRDPLVAAGLVQLDVSGRRAMVPEDARFLLRVLRAMDRHRVFDEPTPATLTRYLGEHFSNQEIERLGGAGLGRGYMSRPVLAEHVGFEGWVGDLLHAKTDAALARWATERGAVLTQPPDASIRLLRDVQSLAHQLADHPDGMPLRELVQSAGDDGVPALADALYTALEFIVAVAGLRGTDLEPMVGLWPPVARALRQPVSVAPAAVLPDEQFTLAIAMEDMTTLLVAAAADPVRLRTNDRAVFARARKEIDTRLVVIPAWVSTLVAHPDDVRVDTAARELQWRALARVRGIRDAPYLEATSAGKRWLALSPHDRLATILDPLRNSREQNPASAYEQGPGVPFFPYSLPFYRMPKALRIRDALTSAFLSVTDAHVLVDDFLDHFATSGNPLLAIAAEPGSRAAVDLFYFHGAGDQRKVLRDLWRSMLREFLALRLMAFGGASLGRTADGRACFALTDAGRYLLGAARQFAYGEAEIAHVVVQPNFDVVFMGVAPAVEATIARFSERAGPAPGIVFRITRASVLAAAEGGMTSDDVLATLRGASSRPMPGNVEREIRGWMSQVRRATLRTAMLVECPTEETAERVASLLGGKVRRLAPTVFELPVASASARTTMVRKLRASGVFLEVQHGSVSPAEDM